MKKIQLTNALAEKFYSVHKEKPFFTDLVEFMTSGPVIVMALEKLGILPYESLVKTQADTFVVIYLDLSNYTIDNSLVYLIP